MGVEAVEQAIRHGRRVIGEWEDVDLNEWREDQTRYAVIDPIVRALGWDTSDPKECCPEYGREGGRADYAIFGADLAIEEIGRAEATPLILIEAKPVDADLETAPDQLAGYVDADPAMSYGAGVVTNGRHWWIYDLTIEGDFPDKCVQAVNITEGAVGTNAKTLYDWLGKGQW